MFTLKTISFYIQIWLYPPGLVLLLMLCAFILAGFSQRIYKILMICAFMILWILSTPVFTQFFIDNLQNKFKPLEIGPRVENLANSAIVVLGSGIENAQEYQNKNTVSARTLSRLNYAAYLHEKLNLPIIVSGGNKDKTKMTEADLMKEVLKTNYHIESFLIENKSRNTQDESNMLLPILKSSGTKHIILVTNAWHMPRSMFAFKRVFANSHIEIIPAPMGYISIQSNNRIANYMPSLSALNTSVFALHEYFGLIWYYFYT